MQKKQNTISRVFVRHQTISAIILLLLFLFNSAVLYFAQRKNAVSERSYQVQIAANETNAKIREIEDAVKETMSTIMNNYDGLWSEEAGKKCFDKQKLNRLVANKMMFLKEIDCFFAFRPGDFTVFQSSDYGSIFDRLALKEYMIDNASSLVTTIKERKWTICQIKDSNYLVNCYYYANTDIYVGVAIEPRQLFSEMMNLTQNYYGAFTITDHLAHQLQSGVVQNSDISNVNLARVPLEGELYLDTSFTIHSLQMMEKYLLMEAVLGFGLCVLFLLFTNRLLIEKIIQPIQAISAAVQNIEDVAEQSVIPTDAQVYEIRNLESALDTLLHEVVYSRMRLYTTEIQKKEQELSMLRAQLRPHFFLNAITTVNAMTYQNRNGDIRNYLIKLSGFLRYTMNGTESLVSLSDELNNVDNYFQMQEIRYPGKVMTFVDCDARWAKTQIPRFLLLTIVENAFKYAMRPDDILQIFIQCRPYAEENVSGVLITIEDNGYGFSHEQLDHYNDPDAAQVSEQAHIGISNVKQTLLLHYGKSGMLHLCNAIPVGAKIEIRIPDKKIGQEEDV